MLLEDLMEGTPMYYITSFLFEFVSIAAEMAPYLLFGFINEFLPREWFFLPGMIGMQGGHEAHSILPLWSKYLLAIVLGILMINGYYQTKKHPAHSCSCNTDSCGDLTPPIKEK